MSNLTEQTTTNNREFKVGDAIVRRWNNRVYWIITDVDNGSEFMISENKNAKFKDCKVCDMPCNFTHATPEEIKLGHRLDHFRDVADMDDDAHIENHISPLCKTESQPVLIVERDNQIIERLKVENVVLQAKVDELQAENKILNQAAATHLRNQNQFMGLYNRLVEQLYPYAIDLEDPVDGDVNTPKEYMDGYNRAREIAHYNLLEMMESDEEYICAQCDMLGGGGEA